MCEHYYTKNDFKLNILDKFVGDHLPKHLVEIANCFSNQEFKSLPTIADKDRAFLECKNNWRSNLLNKVVPDLEVKAIQLLD